MVAGPTKYMERAYAKGRSSHFKVPYLTSLLYELYEHAKPFQPCRLS